MKPVGRNCSICEMTCTFSVLEERNLKTCCRISSGFCFFKFKWSCIRPFLSLILNDSLDSEKLLEISKWIYFRQNWLRTTLEYYPYILKDNGVKNRKCSDRLFSQLYSIWVNWVNQNQRKKWPKPALKIQFWGKKLGKLTAQAIPSLPLHIIRRLYFL